jgi:hypothetical protein
MPEKAKGRGQTMCSPWSYMVGVGNVTEDPTLEKCFVMKPGRRLKPQQGCSASKVEEEGERRGFHATNTRGHFKVICRRTVGSCAKLQLGIYTIQFISGVFGSHCTNI